MDESEVETAQGGCRRFSADGKERGLAEQLHPEFFSVQVHSGFVQRDMGQEDGRGRGKRDGTSELNPFRQEKKTPPRINGSKLVRV